MTLIKSEPNTGTIADCLGHPERVPVVPQGSQSKNSRDQVSRPALEDVPINRNAATSREKELQRQKYVNFLLNTKAVDVVDRSKVSEKVHEKGSIVKREADVTLDRHFPAEAKTPEKPNKIVKEISKSSRSQGNKRLESKIGFREMSVEASEKSDANRRAHTETANSDNWKADLEHSINKTLNKGELERCESAGEFPATQNPLYDIQETGTTNALNLEELFGKPKTHSDYDLYQEAVHWSLKDWIDHGQQLFEQNHALMAELIQKRIEVSLKFQSITNLINDRAMALNQQDTHLQEKLERIKKIGSEILDII